MISACLLLLGILTRPELSPWRIYSLSWFWLDHNVLYKWFQYISKFSFDRYCIVIELDLYSVRFWSCTLQILCWYVSSNFQRSSERFCSPPGVYTSTCELYQWGSYWVPAGFDSFFGRGLPAKCCLLIQFLIWTTNSSQIHALDDTAGCMKFLHLHSWHSILSPKCEREMHVSVSFMWLVQLCMWQIVW